MWRVVDPASGARSLVVDQATNRSTPPRSSRWAVESRRIERTNFYSADRRVAISFPIDRGPAIRAKVKSNAITAVGISLVDFLLTHQSHLLFRISRTEMESGAGGTPCNGTDKPDTVHLWQTPEAS